MKTTKKIDLGEYIILIKYDTNNNKLNITVLDELGGLIETINISDDEDDIIDIDEKYKLN